MPRSALRALAALVLAALPAPAESQLVPVKTVPVASGDQFLIFPSQRLGMGSVSIAAVDTLGDPFVNPALGSRVRETVLFGAPAVYSISRGNGGAQTLPVGVLGAGRAWHGGLTFALQEVQAGDGSAATPWWDPGTGRQIPGRIDSARNVYLSGLLGAGDERAAVGVGVSYAGLNMVDGVDLLYAGSQRIEQEGSQVDVRLGARWQPAAEHEVELVLLRNHFDVAHDVTYLDVRWDTLARTTRVSTREEHNVDRTGTWGAHLTYSRPLTPGGWRIGWAATANYKDHPKIPNYEIMNIPRDPGWSWAYEAGVGLSRTEGRATVAVDAIFQPIRSETWAEADTAVTTAVTGRRIGPGERTVENHFDFTNFLLRMGVGREEARWGLQLGLQLRSVGYELEQRDFVLETDRTQDESWMEWSPTWSGSVRFPEFQLRYAGRATTGTGRPSVGGGWGGRLAQSAASLESNFIVAPSGELSLERATVTTHQITVIFPIR